MCAFRLTKPQFSAQFEFFLLLNLGDLRYRVRCDFVTAGVERLHLRVIGPLMRDIEGAGDGAPVRVLATAVENVLVDVPVEVVDGVVEGEQHDLRYVGRIESTWANKERMTRGKCRFSQLTISCDKLIRGLNKV